MGAHGALYRAEGNLTRAPKRHCTVCTPFRPSRCGNLVEILWDVCVDSVFRSEVWLKGFEDSRIQAGQASVCRPYPSGLNASPLRRKSDSVFDNLVERASRERTVRAQVRSDLTRWATDHRRSKTGRPRSTWSPAHPFERWSWQPTFYPSVGEQVSNESLILAQNQRWRRA